MNRARKTFFFIVLHNFYLKTSSMGRIRRIINTLIACLVLSYISGEDDIDQERRFEKGDSHCA